MPSPVKLHSINRSMLYTNTTFSLTVLLITSLAFLWLFIQQCKVQLINDTTNIANVILKSNHHLIEKSTIDNTSSYKELELYSHLPSINFIYLYKIAENKELLLAATYNKNSFSPSLYPSAEKIKKLSTAHYANEKVDFIQAYRNNETDNIEGYIHIQTNMSSMETTYRQMLIMIVALFSLTLLIAFLINSNFLQKLNTDLSVLIGSIQFVSQRKDYSHRCQQLEFKELDVLARTFNIMLSRTEKHVSKKISSEQEILHLNQELEDKVNRRTEALKESNQELLSTLEKLHQFQGQLVENEKMASLGDMVAGIAHELNTPVGLGITASSLLADNLSTIKHAYDEKTLKGSELNRFLIDNESNIGIIKRNLKRTAELISSFKQVAVDQYYEENKTFNIKQLIDGVCITLAHELRDTDYKINIHCDDDLIVNSKAGPLNQILINLIMNSKIHAFQNTNNGEITINVIEDSNQLNIIYQDNGVGIDESIKHKVFEPFVTTKRGEGGSGLGLHLVYNLVTQALGGSIQLNTPSKQGVIFEIKLPI